MSGAPRPFRAQVVAVDGRCWLGTTTMGGGGEAVGGWELSRTWILEGVRARLAGICVSICFGVLRVWRVGADARVAVVRLGGGWVPPCRAGRGGPPRWAEGALAVAAVALMTRGVGDWTWLADPWRRISQEHRCHGGVDRRRDV